MYLAYETIAPGQSHAAGRELLARLYEAHVGGGLPEIAVNPWGKPCFVNSPWHFSISHTKRHVFCVLSKTPVGLDAEEMDRKVNPQLAHKILSPGEMQRFQSQQNQQETLLKLWVLKEAAAKLSGKGLQGYPNHTDFDSDDPRVQQLAGCYVAILEE